MVTKGYAWLMKLCTRRPPFAPAVHTVVFGSLSLSYSLSVFVYIYIHTQCAIGVL